MPPPLIVTSTKSAELIKHACNAFLAMKISFINAVASVCESVGADVNQVVHGIGTDSRIGRRFLNPGIGFGGSCFPKDIMAFRAVARECSYDFRLLDEVMRINEDQRQRFLRKVHSALWTLRGKNLGGARTGLQGRHGRHSRIPSAFYGAVAFAGRQHNHSVRSGSHGPRPRSAGFKSSLRRFTIRGSSPSGCPADPDRMGRIRQP